MPIKQRHDECPSCVHHNPNRIVKQCLKCGAGEFFEEIIVETSPTEKELREFAADMNNDEEKEAD